MRHYTSINAIIAANEQIGKDWFSPANRRFFGSKVLPTIYGGQFFITSEFSGFDRDERAYTIRKAEDDGSVTTVGEFLAYPTRWEAVKAARAVAAA